MTISSVSIGAVGMQRATERFEASSSRIANYGTQSGSTDLATDVVEVMQAQTQFETSAAVVRMANDLARTTIDILA